ncbi:MAG: hypothetical protein ACJAU6_001758 [Alphaproteobacteria bacterium]|jgi:hypothetical protein
MTPAPTLHYWEIKTGLNTYRPPVSATCANGFKACGQDGNKKTAPMAGPSSLEPTPSPRAVFTDRFSRIYTSARKLKIKSAHS